MKKRLMKKYLKRISEGQKAKREIPFFYVSKAKRIVDEYFEWFHFSVFRPWWYEQDWKEMNFAVEMGRQYKSAEDDFEAKWSMDLGDLCSEYKYRKRVQTRKPSKPKPKPPARRLRKPETFSIKTRQNELVEVEGEIAFQHQGYKFFIYRNGSYWTVSDVICGSAISIAETYKKAVSKARERVTINFIKYVALTKLNSIRREDI